MQLPGCRSVESIRCGGMVIHFMFCKIIRTFSKYETCNVHFVIHTHTRTYDHIRSSIVHTQTNEHIIIVSSLYFERDPWRTAKLHSLAT